MLSFQETNIFRYKNCELLGYIHNVVFGLNYWEFVILTTNDSFVVYVVREFVISKATMIYCVHGVQRFGARATWRPLFETLKESHTSKFQEILKNIHFGIWMYTTYV